MNQPSSFGSFTRKVLAISAGVMTATACQERVECPPDVDCSAQEAANEQLGKDLAKAREELAKALGAGTAKDQELASCKTSLSSANAAQVQKPAETSDDRKNDIEQKKVEQSVSLAIQKASVRPENREMITIVLTKLLTAYQEPAADDYVLRQIFGDDIKMQMIPLKRQTTVASVSADFLKTMSELPMDEKIIILKWLGNCMPEALEAANKFKKYEKLFRNRVFDVCPDAFVIGKPNYPDCEEESLVEEYHDLPHFQKMVMRLMWQIAVRPETVKRIGKTVTTTTRENGFGL